MHPPYWNKRSCDYPHMSKAITSNVVPAKKSKIRCRSFSADFVRPPEGL